MLVTTVGVFASQKWVNTTGQSFFSSETGLLNNLAYPRLLENVCKCEEGGDP